MVFDFHRSEDILWRRAVEPETADAAYEAPAHEERVLPAGWQLGPNKACFLVDTVWERDVRIPLRDGVKIRADVYRPKDADLVPALIAWSPYGKSACRQGGKVKVFRAQDTGVRHY